MHLGVSEWAILAAATVGFGTGAIWYGIFAQPWMKAVGVTRDQITPNVMPYIVAAISNLLVAFVFANLVGGGMISDWVSGLVTGFMLWLGFTVSFMSLNYAFAGRTNSLTIIDGGHALLNICLQGVVIGWFAAA